MPRDFFLFPCRKKNKGKLKNVFLLTCTLTYGSRPHRVARKANLLIQHANSRTLFKRNYWNFDILKKIFQWKRRHREILFFCETEHVVSLFSLSCKYYVGTYLYCHRRNSWAKKSAKRKRGKRRKKERKLSITGANHPQQQQHKKKKKKQEQDLCCDEWILNGQIGKGFLSLFIYFSFAGNKEFLQSYFLEFSTLSAVKRYSMFFNMHCFPL